MTDNKEQRICIKFYFKLGNTAPEIHRMLKEAFGDNALGKTQTYECVKRFENQWRTQDFFFVGGSTNSVEDRGRENGDLGWSGVPLNFQMNETHILIRLLWMYIPRNWEFGSALAKLGISGEGG
jgi:hypothetical protein